MNERIYLSELNALLGIASHDASQQVDVVRLIVDFLGVENDLLELTSFGKALDHFHWYISAEVDG